MLYTVEYSRFYLRDLESIVVWRSRLWIWRLMIPSALFLAFGICLRLWVNATAGAIFIFIGLAWAMLELALGPTARSRIRATGAIVDLPLVKRSYRARKALAAIDAAVRASRDVTMQPAVVSTQTNSEAASAVPSIADATQTNGF